MVRIESIDDGRKLWVWREDLRVRRVTVRATLERWSLEDRKLASIRRMLAEAYRDYMSDAS